MERPDNKWPWLAVTVAAFFVVLAITGSVLTSRQMNLAADSSNASAGRSGDPKPDTIQQQPNDSAAHGPSTTGQNPDGAVPPAR